MDQIVFSGNTAILVFLTAKDLLAGIKLSASRLQQHVVIVPPMEFLGKYPKVFLLNHVIKI